MQDEEENAMNSSDTPEKDAELEAFELTPENELERKLKEHKEKTDDLTNRLQRLQAEFENYKKRMNKRIDDIRGVAGESILLKLLEVYDNVERALEVDFEENPGAAEEGVAAIRKQLEKLFTHEGVRPIECNGQDFDPYYQHAVQKVHNPDEPDGIVLEEYQKGYMLKNKVLRPALVCVNRRKIGDEDSSDNNEDNKNDDTGE
ncbi:MAG: nucleotide exchange factor GrpE [Candidatus Thorarchaeota archaeon]|nr:nucleotide exchange factor GrpE [Candidatus Thorarchaeota archaeon]